MTKIIKGKSCFCIGPENCKDSSCDLVKNYRKKHNNWRILRKNIKIAKQHL